MANKTIRSVLQMNPRMMNKDLKKMDLKMMSLVKKMKGRKKVAKKNKYSASLKTGY